MALNTKGFPLNPFNIFGGRGRERELTAIETPESRLYNQATYYYRTWHAMEGSKRDIIDFDLTEGPSEEGRLHQEWKRSGPSIIDRKNIVRGFEYLYNEAMAIEASHDSHNLEFLRAQIRASWMFARVKAGENIPFHTLIENTLGVNPVEIPEAILEFQRDRVINKWEEIFAEGMDEKSMKKWRVGHELEPPDALDTFKSEVDQSLDELADFLGDGQMVDYSLIGVDEDKYYWVWADRKDEKFQLKQNFSKERGKIWTPGKAEELGPHEGAEHLGRMGRRLKLIQQGKLHPIFGLTTVHGPEPVVEEGLGVTMTKFMPGKYNSLSPEGQFQVEATILRHMVYGNVHVRLNSPKPPSKKRMVAYINSYLPWENRQEIEDQIEDRTNDKLLRIYLYAYAIGTWMHLVFARTLNRKGRREMVSSLFSAPYTPAQEIQLWDRLIKNPEFQSKYAYQAVDFINPKFLKRDQS